MKIVSCMFERNLNVRMIVKVLDLLHSSTDNFNAIYFAKCNKVSFLIEGMCLALMREL